MVFWIGRLTKAGSAAQGLSPRPKLHYCLGVGAKGAYAFSAEGKHGTSRRSSRGKGAARCGPQVRFCPGHPTAPVDPKQTP